MNTVFLPWDAFNAAELRMIAIEDRAVTLVYKNDSEVALAFEDTEQVDRFVGHLVGSLIGECEEERLQWN